MKRIVSILEKFEFKDYTWIAPKRRFDTHSHASEQITMVLQGELFFEVKHRIICVKKGELIAIPSNIPHAAFTKDNSVIAADARSPVNKKYRYKENRSWENERIITGCIGMKP